MLFMLISSKTVQIIGINVK